MEKTQETVQRILLEPYKYLLQLPGNSLVITCVELFLYSSVRLNFSIQRRLDLPALETLYLR